MSQRAIWAITIAAGIGYVALLTFTFHIGPRP